MDLNFAVRAPDRPGKTSVWTTFRRPGKTGPLAAARASSPPAHGGVGSLDAVRAAFWQAFRHLFPPHALVTQTANGSMVISWSVLDEPQARYPYAAPVMLRFDPLLLDAMAGSDARQRASIAQAHEPALREGLRGYDPFARFPNARVVVIG